MPRSASRDLADRLSGLRRFFQKWNSLERWKMYASLVAFLLFAGWGIASLASRKLDHQATHGELANVHQRWSSDCDACHAKVKGSHWFDAESRWNTFKCDHCHSGAPHHANMKDNGDNCASCHHDHAGKDASLVRMNDRNCTNCHGDLKNNTVGEGKYADATSFASNHPEFRSLKDPKTRGLKFSHARHLVPGQVLNEGMLSVSDVNDPRYKAVWRLKDIEPEYRSLYAKAGEGLEAPVQLDCASCHQLDSSLGTDRANNAGKALSANGAPVGAILPPRSEGSYYQQINFDLHCKACHPTKAAENPTVDQQVKEPFAVPHRLNLSKLTAQLQSEYARLLPKPSPALAMRGPVPAEMTAYDEQIRRYAQEGVKYLWSAQCVKCHEREPSGEVKDPGIRTIWMEHARFDHTSHRFMDCKSCHPGTQVDHAANFRLLALDRPARIAEENKVKIEGLASCRECHSPKGGVRHGCVDCHSYHHGDFPLQGRGSPALGPKAAYKPEDLLKGK